MRRGLALGVVALCAAGVSTAIAADMRPDLTVTDREPLAVRGTGFAPRERVTVRVRPIGFESFSKTVRATTGGRFVAVFAQHTMPECVRYTIAAVGARGSRATLRDLIPPPGCGIELQP